jgi:hypothetical protein
MLPTVTGRTTVGIVSVVLAQALPVRTTGVGAKVGVLAVSIVGEMESDGMMLAL